MLQNMTLGSRVRVAYPEPTVLKNQGLAVQILPRVASLRSWHILGLTFFFMFSVIFRGGYLSMGVCNSTECYVQSCDPTLGVFVSEYFLLALVTEHDTDTAYCPHMGYFRH